ncbi:MAG: QueT transporter family protein [Butyrivibrio sp.]|nr:QueT transporter family protein [Butyrivibrio sp.]
MQNKKILFMTQAALIAAIYVVLTMMVAQVNLASGAIQFRISEALCVLPYFTPAAVPGVIIGCLLSNILIGSALPDIIFGTLATAIGAYFSYKLRNNRILVTLPPVISNMIIIPFVLTYAYKIPGGIPFQMLTVGAGEVIACVVLGSILIAALMPVRRYIFGDAYGEFKSEENSYSV